MALLTYSLTRHALEMALRTSASWSSSLCFVCLVSIAVVSIAIVSIDSRPCASCACGETKRAQTASSWRSGGRLQRQIWARSGPDLRQISGAPDLRRSPEAAFSSIPRAAELIRTPEHASGCPKPRPISQLAGRPAPAGHL